MPSRLFWKLSLSYAVTNFIAWLVITQGLSTQPRVWIVAVVSLLAALLPSLWFAYQLLDPVRKLTIAAKEMARGNYNEPTYLSSAGELGQLAATINDVRQNMFSQLTLLSETNQQLSAVLGGMTDGVIAIDENQVVRFANRAAGALMQFSPKAAKGRPLVESVRSHTLQSLVLQLLASHGKGQVELEWGDGGEQTLLIIATSISEAPSQGILMVIHNLSEVRQLEAMRRDFVANVSHELRTPLSSIKAYAETLSAGAIEDKENRLLFVQRIEEQADRLNQLIHDLLSLARIEAGTEHLTITTIPIKRVIQQCFDEQQRAAEKKQIKLDMQAGHDAFVSVDEDGMRQILINLIDNAIKYTPEHGHVTVGWETTDQHVAIFVRDSGIGIPPEMQSRVFERFFRVEKARSRELGGTGLGLGIVKHLCQTFGGNVQVESEPDQGSCFTVTLPIAEPPQ